MLLGVVHGLGLVYGLFVGGFVILASLAVEAVYLCPRFSGNSSDMLKHADIFARGQQGCVGWIAHISAKVLLCS